jgi:hypothetical protein
MNETTTQKLPNRRGRLANGIVAVTAGALLGAFGTITIIELDVAAQPVPSVDPAEWGSPGHVTMSADAIEQWIKHRTQTPPGATLSADAAEHWPAP